MLRSRVEADNRHVECTSCADSESESEGRGYSDAVPVAVQWLQSSNLRSVSVIPSALVSSCPPGSGQKYSQS